MGNALCYYIKKMVGAKIEVSGYHRDGAGLVNFFNSAFCLSLLFTRLFISLFIYLFITMYLSIENI